MELGFRGEVAELYRRYRRGYPPAVVGALVDVYGLTAADTVVDLGCGTGQLTEPLAAHVGRVLAVDPEPDMLAQVPPLPNVDRVAGRDSDLPVLLAGTSVAAVTVGQALHWMDHEALFRDIRPYLRAGGGVAVVTNGLPLWQQGSAWSRALRATLADWFGVPLTSPCGTDEASQDRYATALTAAGYTVRRATFAHTHHLTPDAVIGSVLSATPADRLPADRTAFATAVRAALAGHGPYVDATPVTLLTGHR
ncbi:MAG TPA: methyltransferase domain-containing protein [Pseudonocardiaceae bacterium]